MTEEKTRRLTVISNNNTDISEKYKTSDSEKVTPPNTGYHTNPMYEKLIKYKEEQRKKRFTVEDLLRW